MSTCEFSTDESTPPVLVAALKTWLPELSWSKVRKLLRSRRVEVAGTLCLDESRRLRVGEVVAIYDESLPPTPKAEAVQVLHVDRDLVVVNKPPRMLTVRHRKERGWQASKKSRQPTLEEVLPDLVYGPQREHRPPLLCVHRIDRDTSGLLVWARREASQQALIEQFAAHDVVRRYKALILETLEPTTVRCRLVRDRGDGLRGSARKPNTGKESVTRITPLRQLSGPDGVTYTEICCELETGRTHQIRIHLTELGHPVCGDRMYRSQLNEPPIADNSGVPRLALHACELGFTHPSSGKAMHFEVDWPADIQKLISAWSP